MRSALCLVALAGCLENPSTPPTPEPAPRLMKVQPPPLADLERPRVRDAEPFEGGSELRAAVRDGRLALIPIVTEDTTGGSYLTLEAGLASGEVIASDAGVIEQISISNRSSRPLVILGGELIVGGHQDRLITQNTVVAAHRTQAVTTVCAEMGRSEGPDRFRAAGGLAEPTLRRLARGGGDQFAVWDRISALTGTISDSYRFAAALQQRGTSPARLQHLLAQLDAGERREERSRTVGFGVAIDDKVIAIERFASPELYRDLRSLVISSYLPGSLGKTRGEPTVGPAEVRAFKEATGAGAPVPPRSRAAAPSAAPRARP